MRNWAALLWIALALLVGGALGMAAEWDAARDSKPVEPPATKPEVLSAPLTPQHVPTSAPEPLLLRDVLIDADSPAGSALARDQAETGIGTGKLRLRLVSDTTGEDVEMDVRLWRLGVPESASWTAGDAGRDEVTVPSRGATFEGLPSGRYRVQVLGLRSGADDPPEFVVSGATTDVVLRVAERRTFRERLRLLDEQGSPIVDATRRRLPASSSSSAEGTPSWASPRTSKDGRSLVRRVRQESFRSRSAATAAPAATRTDATGFFDLGPYLERGRNDSCEWGCDFSSEGRAEVHVASSSAAGADVSFVGVCPRIHSILASVERSDGAPLDRKALTVSATSDALSGPWDPAPETWKSIPIDVWVVGDGYEPLHFVWTAATSSTTHVLVPKPR